jgi:hypothetical protein
MRLILVFKVDKEGMLPYTFEAFGKVTGMMRRL